MKEEEINQILESALRLRNIALARGQLLKFIYYQAIVDQFTEVIAAEYRKEQDSFRDVT